MKGSIQEKIDYILNMQNIISKVCSDEKLLFKTINKLKDTQNREFLLFLYAFKGLSFVRVRRESHRVVVAV